jgi:hypothetical protein
MDGADAVDQDLPRGSTGPFREYHKICDWIVCQARFLDRTVPECRPNQPRHRRVENLGIGGGGRQGFRPV